MRTVLLLPLLAACTPQVEAVSRGKPTTDRALDRAWSQALEDVTAWRAKEGVAGIAVAVIVDGRTRYAEGFGVARDEPVGPHTVFRWASLSKPFVATAALKAEKQGLLDLHDPLSAWLPDFALEGPLASGDPTLEELLTHHSGIADRLVWNCNTDDAWLQEAFSGGMELPLLAPPGAFYNYSNSGYSAFGAILEKVHGQPFVELMEDEVLGPAGLRSATFVAEEADAAGGSPGVNGNGDALMELTDYDCATARPAAWLHADIADLARFIEQLGEGPIAPRMAAAVDTRLRADGGHRVGPGLFSVDYRDRHEAWVHDGRVTGFTSQLTWLPEERLGVVMVANHGGADLPELRRTVVDRFLGYDPAEPRHQPPPGRLRPELVGTYEQPVEGFAPSWATGTLEVLEEDGVLYLRTATPQLGLVELVQSDGDAYVVGAGGSVATLRFLRHDRDLWMVNRAFVARRSDPDLLVP